MLKLTKTIIIHGNFISFNFKHVITLKLVLEVQFQCKHLVVVFRSKKSDLIDFTPIYYKRKMTVAKNLFVLQQHLVCDGKVSSNGEDLEVIEYQNAEINL